MGCVAGIYTPVSEEYIIGGKVIDLNFKTEGEEFIKKISIHETNTLRKAIEMYQELINKNGLRIKKAIYMPDESNLDLNKKLNEFDIDFKNIIIVYFR